MDKFTNTHAEKVIEELSIVASNNLSEYSYEIQDGGFFLLITAQIRIGISEKELNVLMEKIKSNFEKKLPKRKDDYAWMVVIMHGDHVVESVLPDV